MCYVQEKKKKGIVADSLSGLLKPVLHYRACSMDCKTPFAAEDVMKCCEITVDLECALK